MKQVIVVFIFLQALSTAFCQTEALRHYDPNQANFNYPAGFSEFVARFEPPRSGFLSAITVLMNGPANADFEISVYDHEGGTAFPQLEQPLFPFIKLMKSNNGREAVRLDLPEPIHMTNTQFFVVIRNLANGLQLIADNRAAESACNSSSGGNYYFQFLKTRNNAWTIGVRRAFAITAWMDYENHSETPYFKDVTTEWGIDSNLSNRSIACNDVDGDGDLDLLIAGKLYLNNGKRQFEPMNQTYGIEGSPRANLIIPTSRAMADLYFFMHGSASYRYHWEGGNYIQQELAGFPSFESISSVSAADLNKDGYPDFFIGQLWGTYPEPKPNYLLFSKSDGTSYEDKSNLLYPRHDGLSNDPSKMRCDAVNQNSWIPDGNRNKRSRGSQFTDFDNDGDLDLYVTNYFLEEDEFYENQGDGTFKNIIQNKGIDQNSSGHNHGTGVAFEDYDGDGDLDLLLPQFAHPSFSLQYDHRSTTLYENNGSPNFDFTDMKNTHGIDFEETYAGAAWTDLNNDGRSDFIETVFYGCRYVKLFVQNSQGGFELMSHRAGLNKTNTGEDAVWADLDGDGAQELIMGKEGRIRIFKNQWPMESQDYQGSDFPLTGAMNWIGIRAQDEAGSTFLPGTAIEVEWSGGRKRKEMYYGQGVRMQSPDQLHFGIGRDQAANKVTIHWADGSIDRWFQLEARKTHLLQKGQGQEQKTDLVIYGNPVSGTLRFRVGASNEQQRAVIVDIQGREIATFNLPASDVAQFIEHSLHEIKSGVYVLRVGDKQWGNSALFILL